MRKHCVYIAAAATELHRVDRWTKRLKEIGLTVVSTWPASVRAVGESNPRSASKEERAHWAKTCVEEALSADILWLLCPSSGYTTRGAWYELGCVARDPGHRKMIASGDTLQTIFTASADEYTSDEEAFAAIQEMTALDIYRMNGVFD